MSQRRPAETTDVPAVALAMRRAFTLIEILVVVAIMAIMATSAVLGVRAGQDAARVKGATRDIMASIRHARSMALVMMQPAVITYSTIHVDDEVCAQIKVDGAKFMAKASSDTVQTLSGEIVRRDGTKVEDFKKKKTAVGEETKELLDDSGGDSMEDYLFAPLSNEVMRGVRIKVAVGDELSSFEQQEKKTVNKISVFSNVDYLLGKYKEKKNEEEKKESAEKSGESQSAVPAGSEEDQEPVSVVWEANGRCDPHRVWVYLDGSSPEKGLCIKIDHFGAAKIVSNDED
ncbi:MAG: type II secretion system protein [Kiritimatiellae bacterium]|nr:type II secretion system protein [Kiritimatiellia bacterium]